MVRSHDAPGLGLLDYLDTPRSRFLDYQDTSLPEYREPEQKFGGENKYLYYKPTEADLKQILQRRHKRGVKPTVLDQYYEAQ